MGNSQHQETSRASNVRSTAVLAILFATCCSAAGLAGKVAGNEPAISPIAALPTLEQIEPQPIVTVRGVVTFKLWEGLILQDDTAGIWIEVTQSRRMNLLETDIATVQALREGDLVEVTGRANRGGYAPNIVPVTVRKIGEKPLPPARPYDQNRFFHGLDDCLRVEASGIVRGFRDDNDNGRWLFLVADVTREFWVDVAKAALEASPESFIDAGIHCEGVATADFNSRGQLLRPRLNVSSNGAFRLVDAPREVRSLPLADIGCYPDTAHRVRTQGIVTYSMPGSFLYLQSGFAGVLVKTTSTERFADGDLVEAVGFVDGTSPVCGLGEASVRRLRAGSQPEPIAIHPREIIRVNTLALTRYETADPGDYYGCLITFPATVVDVNPGRDGGEIRLLADDVGVTAVSGLLGLIKGRAIEPGSIVQVSGIARPAGEGRRQTSLPAEPTAAPPIEILLRSPQDLQLLRAASWWKPQRLAAVIAALAATVLAAVAWALGLRRQVARQVAVIEEKLQFQAIAGERLRIAREFHDTLEQDLAGIALRLDAAAELTEDNLSRSVLEQQRGLLEQVRRETHDFLWDLRDPARTDGSLMESLGSQIAYLQTLTNVPLRLHLETHASRLSAALQFHLLRIVREAVTNALKHAEPSAVEVRLGSTAAGYTVEIRNDGRGFDVATCSALDGHFGLRGMAERALRMGATLSIDSHPDRGTTVRLFIPEESAS